MRLLIALLLSLGCATTPKHASAAGMLTLVVAGEDMLEIPGAQVTLIHKDGRLEKYGKTDALGRISVSKVDLKSCHLVMVCTDFTYCAALPTSEPRFFEYDEKFVVLATIRLL